MNLAGGTHHAAFDRGGGYCIFNDAVVAARHVQAEGFRWFGGERKHGKENDHNGRRMRQPQAKPSPERRRNWSGWLQRVGRLRCRLG